MDEYALVVNVDAVVARGDEYLLIERSDNEEHAAGLLSFPGGKVEVDAGTSAIESTARREVVEEVGVDVGSVEYVSSNTFVADDGNACLNVVAHCEYEGGEPVVREPEEVADVFWATLDELESRDDVPEFTLAFARQVKEEQDNA